MVIKKYTYEDYNGTERTEEFMFDLNEAELMEMEMSEVGGLQAKIQKISSTQDSTKVLPIFKDVILKAYGEKSADGRRFVKSKELSEAFSQTPAYPMLYMELLTVQGAAAAFFKGIVPQNSDKKIPQDHKKAE